MGELQPKLHLTLRVDHPFDAATVVEVFWSGPEAGEAVDADVAREALVGGGAQTEIPATRDGKLDDVTQVEVEEPDGQGGFNQQLVGHAQHAVEDVTALGERVDEDVGGFDASRERVDAMGVPEGLVSVGGIGVDLNLDVGKPPFVYLGVDFDVGHVTLSDSYHGEVGAVKFDNHARELQVGVDLFREPTVAHLLVKMLYVGDIKLS